MFYTILTVIYILMLLVITVMVVWHMFETESFTDKLIGALMLVFLILRIFLIK